MTILRPSVRRPGYCARTGPRRGFFQLLDGLAQWGLCHAQAAGGPAEVELLRDGQKCLDFRKLPVLVRWGNP